MCRQMYAQLIGGFLSLYLECTYFLLLIVWKRNGEEFLKFSLYQIFISSNKLTSYIILHMKNLLYVVSKYFVWYWQKVDVHDHTLRLCMMKCIFSFYFNTK